PPNRDAHDSEAPQQANAADRGRLCSRSAVKASARPPLIHFLCRGGRWSYSGKASRGSRMARRYTALSDRQTACWFWGWGCRCGAERLRDWWARAARLRRERHALTVEKRREAEFGARACGRWRRLVSGMRAGGGWLRWGAAGAS